MATAPVKSQPLHNFNFPFLKWGNHSTSTDQRSSPELESELEPRNTRVGSRSARDQRFSFPSKQIRKQRKLNLKLEEKFFDLEKETVLLTQSEKSAVDGEKGDNEAGEEELEHEGEDSGKRQWNLRPRKAESVATVAIEKQVEIAAVAAAPKSMRLRGIAENGLGFGEKRDKKEKSKLWISLSREEIEEDIYSMTESRASRRPRKRPKIVQKQLDSIFPGLWLVGTSADSYRIDDSPVKK